MLTDKKKKKGQIFWIRLCAVSFLWLHHHTSSRIFGATSALGTCLTFMFLQRLWRCLSLTKFSRKIDIKAKAFSLKAHFSARDFEYFFIVFPLRSLKEQ